MKPYVGNEGKTFYQNMIRQSRINYINSQEEKWNAQQASIEAKYEFLFNIAIQTDEEVYNQEIIDRTDDYGASSFSSEDDIPF